MANKELIAQAAQIAQDIVQVVHGIWTAVGCADSNLYLAEDSKAVALVTLAENEINATVRNSCLWVAKQQCKVA